MPIPTSTWTAIAACALALGPPAPARAGGFDTPILFTARHTGAGGAAVGYVDDASAVLHNPAGLLGVAGWQVLGNLSLVAGALQTSPDHDDQNASTGNLVAPVPFLAAAARLHDRIAIGLAVFPVAAGGAAYRYPNLAEVDTLDRANLIFVEISPALSVALPHRVSLGLGYRVSTVAFARRKGPADDPGFVDLAMSGTDWTGWRAGVQWRPAPGWQLGATYRHAVSVDISGDSGRAFFRPVRELRASPRLPGKLGVGGRVDRGPAALAIDVEYALQSQNDRFDITARFADDDTMVSVPMVFGWRDAVTIHAGVEYQVSPRLAARAGYAFDGQVTSATYPSAFSTPPSANHSVAAGGGVRRGRWHINAAIAARFAAAPVARDSIASSDECPLCSHAGYYTARMFGLWLDTSVDFEGP